jgi:hypothetical protein
MKFAKKNSKTYQLFNNYCLRIPLFLIQFYKKKQGITSRKKLK